MSDQFSVINSLAEFITRKQGKIEKSTITGNEEGDLFIAQGNANYTEVARRGDLWWVQTSTAFAAIVGVPTTTAPLEVVNNHPTRAFVVDSIWSWQLLGTAVVWAHTPWAQVGQAVYSANAALVFGGGTGDSFTSATSTALRTAINQTVVANGWRVFPGSTMNFGLAAATPGGANVGDVQGRLIVPPGKSLHVAVSGSVNTASAFQCGASGYFADINRQ